MGSSCIVQPSVFKLAMCFLRPIITIFTSLHKRHPKTIKPKSSHSAQPDRQRLLRLNRPWYATPRQHHTGQQRQFQAVGLAVLDAIAAERVEGADGAARGQGGHGARADVACYSAPGGQAGEDVGDLAEGVGS